MIFSFLLPYSLSLPIVLKPSRPGEPTEILVTIFKV